jgi:type VI secretion system protein ImpM
LFGKLQAKRDFIAPHAPPDFLKVWEPWFQAGLSSSRHALDAAWLDHYLQAPIWRFWLGAAICGRTMLGAFMPSLDALGRYYPLVVVAAPPADADVAIAPPEIEDHAAWFAAVESFLLGTLEPESSFEEILTRLDAMSVPAAIAGVTPSAATVALARGAVAAPLDGAPLAQVFGDLRRADWPAAYAGQTFWWTVGGADFRPFAIAARHMPDPQLFTGMLTGRFISLGDPTP